MDLKSTLYAIIQTASFLKTRYQRGCVDTDFYYRRMKAFQEDISQLQVLFLKKGKKISEIASKIQGSENFSSLLRELVSIGDLRLDDLSVALRIDPFQLASVTINITSRFITLLDYLHVTEEPNPNFMLDLFSELESSLSTLQTFQPVLKDVQELKNSVVPFLNFLQSHQSFP